jgi:formylglycine-generating enzyme required for sulfatase activity
MRLHKDAISEITAYNDSQTITQELVQVYLKTGDQFYGEMLSTGVKIQTSYGEFNISTKDIEGMEFEGEGNVLTKIRLKNSSEMRGTIKDDFIVFKLLSGSELSVSPGKIRSILFLKKTKSGVVEVPQSNNLKSAGNMVFVERGSFTMGDTWGDGRQNESPVHEVTLTYDFFVGKYETTFDEYDAFCEATGRSKPDNEGWGRGQRPVINVSWWDATAYCNWLSDKEKLPKAYDSKGNLLDKDGRVTTDPSKVVGYRLPTEAEWEYAARGGKYNSPYKYSGSDNVSDVAWYGSNSGSKTHEVGTKAPNDLGIHDMSGNVWEWCSDWYGNYSSSPQTNPYKNSGSYRVFRGGCCYDIATRVRVADRSGGSPAGASYGLGFRIARTVP